MDVNIVTLAHRGEEKLGLFRVSVDVVHADCVEDILAQRKQEGFYVNPKWSPSSGVSPVIKTEPNGHLRLRLKVHGALKSGKSLVDGQDILEYNGASDCQKVVALTRNPSDSSGKCTLAFTSNSTLLHETVISGIGSPSTISLMSLDHVDPMDMSSLEENSHLSLPGHGDLNESTVSLSSYDQISPMDSPMNDSNTESMHVLAVPLVSKFNSNPSTASLQSSDNVPAMDADDATSLITGNANTEASPVT